MSFKVGFEGVVDEDVITFTQDGLVESDIGKPVKITKNMTVKLCEDDDPFIGVIVAIEKDTCSVKIKGVIEALYTGTAPVLNRTRLIADGEGKVKRDDSASDNDYRTILNLDVPNTKVAFLL